MRGRQWPLFLFLLFRFKHFFLFAAFTYVELWPVLSVEPEIYHSLRYHEFGPSFSKPMSELLKLNICMTQHVTSLLPPVRYFATTHFTDVLLFLPPYLPPLSLCSQLLKQKHKHHLWPLCPSHLPNIISNLEILIEKHLQAPFPNWTPISAPLVWVLHILATFIQISPYCVSPYPAHVIV